ncbi:hypothetical protein V5F77_06920 [Xanthobacter sp. DSM 24535]|uniref:ImuA family protein n=1 Tax=Roseixanthobacter psychrophilus TaxID=3119917 RepID=UPI003729FFDD
MSNPSAIRAAGELARLRRCISAIERGAGSSPASAAARAPTPWSAGEAQDWGEEEWGDDAWNQDAWNQDAAGRNAAEPGQNAPRARPSAPQDESRDGANVEDAPRTVLPLGAILPFGIPALDATLGGGLALGALHEAAALHPGAEGALTAFALTLAARAAFQLKRPVLMVQHELAELEAGSLYAPGLAELGLCGGALILVRVRKAQDVLFVMEEGLKCGGLSAVLGEVGTVFPEALTATRRLSLAARARPVLGLLLRQRPDGAACAALTRWTLAPAPSRPDDSHGGLGPQTVAAGLRRNRLGPLGSWTLALAGAGFRPVAPDVSAPDVSAPAPNRWREAGS